MPRKPYYRPLFGGKRLWPQCNNFRLITSNGQIVIAQHFRSNSIRSDKIDLTKPILNAIKGKSSFSIRLRAFSRLIRLSPHHCNNM